MDTPLNGSPELMAIDEQSNHRVVHLLRLRKTDRLSRESLEPSSRLLNACAQFAVCLLSPRCDAVHLTIASKHPNYRCRIALSRMDLTVAEVVSSLRLRALLTHTPALLRCDDQWRATTSADVALTPQSSTFHPSLLLRLAPPSPLQRRVVAVPAALDSLVLSAATFFQCLNHRRRANPQHSCRVAAPTAIDCHIADLLLHFLQSSPIAEVQNKRASGTGTIAATIALFTCGTATMLHDINAVAIGTMNRF